MTDSFHKDFDNIERALFQSHWELKTNLLLKKEAQDNVRPVEKQIRQYRQYIIWTRQTYGPLGGVIGHYHQRIENIVHQYQELQTLYDQLLEVQHWEDLVDTKAELLAAIQKSNRQWEQDARKSAEVLLQDQTNRAGTCSSPDIDSGIPPKTDSRISTGRKRSKGVDPCKPKIRENGTTVKSQQSDKQLKLSPICNIWRTNWKIYNS